MKKQYTYQCEKGLDKSDNHKCPNMKYDEEDTSMESERYECKTCGQRYKLYYEDMA